MAILQGPAPEPKPDADGVYRLDPGITPPQMKTATAAAFPLGATETDTPHIGIYEAVIGVDGLASRVKPVFGRVSDFDPGAIDAIAHCTFQPGTLHDRPVPVLVHIRVPFFHLNTAMPQIQRHYAQERAAYTGPPDPYRMHAGDVRPKLIHSVEAEMTDAARRNKIEGTVLVSFLVQADGTPTDVKVVRPLGYGLDENAVKTVSRWQFQPALRDGQPVAVRLNAEISYKLY